MDVGIRVKAALSERGYTQRKLCSALDITENGFKRMLDNNTWKVDTLSKIASILNKPITYFITDDELEFDDKSNHSLSKHETSDLRELKMLFEEELKVKNQQIAGLQRTLEILVGKSEGAIYGPLLSAGEDDFQKVEAAYVSAVIHNSVMPMLEEIN